MIKIYMHNCCSIRPKDTKKMLKKTGKINPEKKTALLQQKVSRKNLEAKINVKLHRIHT